MRTPDQSASESSPRQGKSPVSPRFQAVRAAPPPQPERTPRGGFAPGVQGSSLALRSEGVGEAHPAVDGGVHRFVRQDVVVQGLGIVEGRADGQGVGDQVFSAYL